MASDDEGFALSVTSKLREYEQGYVRSGEEVSCKTLTQTNQKSKKTDKCIGVCVL